MKTKISRKAYFKRV